MNTTTKEQLNNKIWVELFRPKSVKEILLPKDFKTFFNNIVKTKNIPNLLLESSTPGSGKTTLAKALCADLDADYIYINVSSENGIDTLRTQIKQFASTKSFTNKPKIVIMDEFDGATPNLQDGLRAFIEQFHNSCRFILTCNYVSKIIPALREGRLMEFNFNMKNEEYKIEMVPKIQDRLSGILKFNKIDFEPSVVKKLVEENYPNIRKMVSTIQKASNIHGSIDQRLFNISEVDNELFDLILNKQITNARNLVISKNYSYSEVYEKMLNDFVPMLKPEARGEAILTIAEYEYRNAFTSSPDLQFAACLINIVSLL